MITLHDNRGAARKKAEAYNEPSKKVGANIIQKVKKSRFGGGIK